MVSDHEMHKLPLIPVDGNPIVKRMLLPKGALIKIQQHNVNTWLV